jgi:hypothetical protein
MHVLRTDPLLLSNLLPAAGLTLTSHGHSFESRPRAQPPSRSHLPTSRSLGELRSEVRILSHFPTGCATYPSTAGWTELRRSDQ